MLSYAANAGSRLANKLRQNPVTKRSSLLKIQKRFNSDHYATLGVSSTASASEIKKAFFEKAKKVHPDVNKGDPNAQKKFVELSAAYEVLKKPDKRAQYDAQRSYGGYGFGQQQSSSYQSGPSSSYGRQQSQQQQTGYNPFRSGGGNPYGPNQGQQQGASADEFMNWYRSQYGDSFREFDEFNRGQTTIIEERMPDGSIRVRIIKTGSPHSHGRQSQHQRQQQHQQQQQQQQGDIGLEDVLRGMFSGANFFASAFQNGFRNRGENAWEQAESASRDGYAGIPFGSGYLEGPTARISEIPTDSSFYVSSGRHIGTMSHRELSGDQGDVLSCVKDGKILAKARSYVKNGTDRILIENGSSVRIATIESLASIAPVVSQNLLSNSPIAPLQAIQQRLSLHYQILDENDRLSGYMIVSPFRRKLKYFDTQGQLVAINERNDIEQENLQVPTLDDWRLSIQDHRLFDSSVFLFSAAFSTLSDRKSNFPIPGARTLARALAKMLSFSSPKS